MNKIKKLLCLTTLFATATFWIASSNYYTVSANNTPQTLPLAQDWTNAGLITVNDDWTAVPGIVGYLGDIAATATTGVDPRTLLADYTMLSAVDVIANQANPDTLTNGGVAEFAITNPVVALNGSGTADAPHIIIHLNTTGQTGIRFRANIRDIDGSADDAIQPIDVQYRVGGAGDYTSVAGGFFADVTTAGAATQVTPVDVTLPANANNQANLQIRIMTTNAVGNDEWVGIDDIQVTGGPAVPADAAMDMNGDGRSDYVVVRNVGGGPGGQIRWFYNHSGTADATIAKDWGIASDFFLAEDFDGDFKDDITVWRPSVTPNQSRFYILKSSDFTAIVDVFGQSGDDPTMIADYDGDGKSDVAVYRPGAAAGDPSTWFYRGSLTPANITYIPWGQNGDFPAPGDYDGDNKNDFAVQRNAGGGQAGFWIRLATGAIQPVVFFGTPTDVICPGDYDGDGKTDLMVTRGSGGQILWVYRSSLDSSINWITFGLSATDFQAHGDYDGDGRTDVAVWRPNLDPAQNFFITRSTASGATAFFELGQNGDYPVANFRTH